MKAWLFQNARQKKTLGNAAPWMVGWHNPEGRRRSKTFPNKSEAKKYQQLIAGQLVAGTYQEQTKELWADFRKQYEAEICSGMKPATRRCTIEAMDRFERISSPGRMDSIKTQMIDSFIAARRRDLGRKDGDTVSPATVNRDLRHLKAVLRVANDWGCLPIIPKIRMVKEPKKLPRFVTAEHFAAIYGACKAAAKPVADEYTAADWWRALVAFLYLTGWRVGETLALRWSDVSLDTGHAITRHEDNKGDRDESVPLVPIVVDHLRKLFQPGCPFVFGWDGDRRRLYDEFGAIQDAAGIDLPCSGQHEHTDACHRYGFHDFRRAYATENATELPPTVLQKLMRHKSFSTTQQYINMSPHLDEAVKKVHVPDCAKGLGASTG